MCKKKVIDNIKLIIKKYTNKVPLYDIPISNNILSDSWFNIKESDK